MSQNKLLIKLRRGHPLQFLNGREVIGISGNSRLASQEMYQLLNPIGYIGVGPKLDCIFLTPDQVVGIGETSNLEYRSLERLNNKQVNRYKRDI